MPKKPTPKPDPLNAGASLIKAYAAVLIEAYAAVPKDLLHVTLRNVREAEARTMEIVVCVGDRRVWRAMARWESRRKSG